MAGQSQQVGYCRELYVISNIYIFWSKTLQQPLSAKFTTNKTIILTYRHKVYSISSCMAGFFVGWWEKVFILLSCRPSKPKLRFKIKQERIRSIDAVILRTKSILLWNNSIGSNLYRLYWPNILNLLQQDFIYYLQFCTESQQTHYVIYFELPVGVLLKHAMLNRNWGVS